MNGSFINLRNNLINQTEKLFLDNLVYYILENNGDHYTILTSLFKFIKSI
jgi:hypothetical protein